MKEPKASNERGSMPLIDRIMEPLQLALTSSGWPAQLAWRILGPHYAELEQHMVQLTAPTAPPLRIAFASDFHAGPATHPELWRDACRILTEARPDLLLLGGDFVSLHARYIDELAERLGAIPAPLGRYAVLGNHDLWTDYRYLEQRLESAGIELLTNRNVRLPAPFDHLWVCGLDDHGSGLPDAEAAFAGAEGHRILLMHQPSGLLDAGNHHVDVAFCGHTHGGQIALPGGTPIVVPRGLLSRKYCRGTHRLDSGCTLFVSRGVGCSGLPLRAFSKPDVILCTITSVAGGA